MAVEVIQKSREEDLHPFSATQKVASSPSLAVLGFAAEQLEALTQPSDRKKESPSRATGVKTGQLQKKGDKKIQFSQSNVFKAAGEMSKLQTENNNSLENELKNELRIMEAQLKAMQAAEKFWEEFGPAWAAFEKDPSNYEAFEKVMKILEAEYSKDPNMENELKQIENEGTEKYNKERHWHHHSGWHHFWHGEPLSNPHYFKDFANSINSKLTQIAEGAVGNPELFANALLNGDSTFQAKIRQLFQTVEILMDIVKILEGSRGSSQTAMFDMEALLMDLEQLQINTNTQKSQQQQQISQETAKNMQNNLKKIQKALKKASEHHSGGLFGFIGKIFEGIAHFVAAVFDVMTGQESAAAKEIGKSYGDFKDVGTQLFDLIKLVGQAIAALAEVAAAGLLAEVGDHQAASNMLEKAKKMGEDMLANPALKLLADIAMVAIMVAAAVTGQFWLAGLMLVLFVMSESGLTQKMTTAIANSIQSDMGGKNSALAKILADVIVIVMITVLSAGAGAAEAALSTAAESAVTAGEEEGIEMADLSASRAAQSADEVAEQGSEEVTTSAENSGSQASRATRIAKRAASVGAYGFGSTLGSSTLALDILKDTSKKDSELLAIILELIQVIVAAVTASIGGFTSITQSASGVARSTESAASSMVRFASRMQVAAASVAAVSGAAQGGETIIQGQTEKGLTKYRANVELDEATQNVTDEMIKQTGEELKHLIKGYEELIATAFKTPEEVANAELQAIIQG